jgi:dipeptidyl aminopeptidase/acylaminoacyl peptidase
LRENAVKDIGHLLKWISTQKDYDSKRIFLIGNSYGGFMVLSVLAHYPESVAGGIDMFGISNFSSFLKNTAKYRQESRQKEYGDEAKPTMLKFLHSISPLQNV